MAEKDYIALQLHGCTQSTTISSKTISSWSNIPLNCYSVRVDLEKSLVSLISSALEAFHLPGSPLQNPMYLPHTTPPFLKSHGSWFLAIKGTIGIRVASLNLQQPEFNPFCDSKIRLPSIPTPVPVVPKKVVISSDPSRLKNNIYIELSLWQFTSRDSEEEG
ncbi:hypothetical protein M0R45_021564 [Rubus argutus]|uniref:Uncharacterized protein n=1 Tax=Rubus argutus TaxID=59490 RepID=A0AAW1XDG5_RUBAR